MDWRAVKGFMDPVGILEIPFHILLRFVRIILGSRNLFRLSVATPKNIETIRMPL